MDQISLRGNADWSAPLLFAYMAKAKFLNAEFQKLLLMDIAEFVKVL